MLMNELLAQEKILRREFYTANYHSDETAVKIALKKLETVLFQQRKSHLKPSTLM
ncbi:MAG: hypothetical protein P4L87_01915 [Formivibrio sp.]|nr:hypothetical protein [Formivibrio sp.]